MCVYTMCTCVRVCMWIHKKRGKCLGKRLIFGRRRQRRLYSCRAVALTSTTTMLAHRTRRQSRREDAEGDGEQLRERSRGKGEGQNTIIKGVRIADFLISFALAFQSLAPHHRSSAKTPTFHARHTPIEMSFPLISGGSAKQPQIGA